jgi:hypothetical protein
MTADDMPALAALIAEALSADSALVAPRTTALRSRFTELHYIRS